MNPELRRAIALGAIVGGLIGTAAVVVLRGRDVQVDKSSFRQFMRLLPTLIGALERLSQDERLS